VEEINECCSGGSGWSKGELVVKEVTMVRVHEDGIKEVLDNRFFHKSGKNRSNGDGPVIRTGQRWVHFGYRGNNASLIMIDCQREDDKRRRIFIDPLLLRDAAKIGSSIPGSLPTNCRHGVNFQPQRGTFGGDLQTSLSSTDSRSESTCRPTV